MDKLWFHLVEQPANDDCKMHPAARAPSPYGWAGRQAVPLHHARLSALLLQIIREPTQTPPGQAARATHTRLPDPDGHQGSRTVPVGRVMSQGGAPSTGACDPVCATGCTWTAVGPFMAGPPDRD